MRREADGSLFDRFAGRLVIPISSSSGDVVGFGARLVEGEEEAEGEGGGGGGGGRVAAKYLNSRESDVFKKSELLYALPVARSAARRADAVVFGRRRRATSGGAAG